MAPINSSPVKIVRIIIKYMFLHNDLLPKGANSILLSTFPIFESTPI